MYHNSDPAFKGIYAELQKSECKQNVFLPAKTPSYFI